MSVLFVKAWLAADALKDRLRREEGQTMVEYALVVGLIAMAAAGALTGLEGRIWTKFSQLLP
jgi:Flp pilus assembly pilin Flp